MAKELKYNNGEPIVVEYARKLANTDRVQGVGLWVADNEVTTTGTITLPSGFTMQPLVGDNVIDNTGSVYQIIAVSGSNPFNFTTSGTPIFTLGGSYSDLIYLPIVSSNETTPDVNTLKQIGIIDFNDNLIRFKGATNYGYELKKSSVYRDTSSFDYGGFNFSNPYCAYTHEVLGSHRIQVYNVKTGSLINSYYSSSKIIDNRGLYADEEYICGANLLSTIYYIYEKSSGTTTSIDIPDDLQSVFKGGNYLFLYRRGDIVDIVALNRTQAVNGYYYHINLKNKTLTKGVDITCSLIIGHIPMFFLYYNNTYYFISYSSSYYRMYYIDTNNVVKYVNMFNSASSSLSFNTARIEDNKLYLNINNNQGYFDFNTNTYHKQRALNINTKGTNLFLFNDNTCANTFNTGGSSSSAYETVQYYETSKYEYVNVEISSTNSYTLQDLNAVMLTSEQLTYQIPINKWYQFIDDLINKDGTTLIINDELYSNFIKNENNTLKSKNCIINLENYTITINKEE